jgi:modification methylase
MSKVPLERFINQLQLGDAAHVMADIPDQSVDLIVTSPPYWTAVEYEGQEGAWPTYEMYLDDMMRVWRQSARVLRQNGKLCINAPIMPIPKNVIVQHTRHLKNIAFDIEQRIFQETDLLRYSLFVWQKQTSKMMFGSYPYPGNLIENNTVEFINVYVKSGKPPRFEDAIKEANRLSRTEWVDLVQQVWFMYPENVKRSGNHPAPFPEKLPARLIRLYTYGAYRDFEGEIVLDPFVGTGTTCAVAKMMGRRYIGIDISDSYLKLAGERLLQTPTFQPMLLVGRAKYPTSDELMSLVESQVGTTGRRAERKHKRKTYGRKLPAKDDAQLILV